MQGWKWPVVEMFRIPGTCLSHRTRITAMHVCDSRFDKHWHGAKSSPSLFQCQLCCNEVQERCPYLSCLQNLDLTLKVKAESKMAYSFEDAARSNPRVEQFLHCCIKLDVQKGGGSKGSPTIEQTCVKTMRWWVLAENLKAFVLTWRYPGGRSDIPAMLIAEAGLAILASKRREKMLLALGTEYIDWIFLNQKGESFEHGIKSLISF